MMVRLGLVSMAALALAGCSTVDDQAMKTITEAAAAAEAVATPPQPAPWQLWWALFFDAPPPTF